MTDMVTMMLILGAGWYAWKEGLLDQLVEQVKSMGGGEAPAPAPTEEAAPAPAEEAAPAEPAPAEEPAKPAEGAEDKPAEGDAKKAAEGGGEEDKPAEDEDKKSNYTVSTYNTVPLNWT